MTVDTQGNRHPEATVAQSLRRIARTRARLDALQADLERDSVAVRRRYEARIASLRKRVEQQRAELEGYCRAQRDAVFPPGRKTLTTPFGEVALRKCEASVRLRAGLSSDEACRLLRARGLGSLVRVKESPDKPAVRRALRDVRVTPEQLEGCGLELVDGEERFHCKVWQDALVVVGGYSG